jgi:hypothetical protein
MEVGWGGGEMGRWELVERWVDGDEHGEMGIGAHL